MRTIRRQTLISLRATHTAHRIASEIANPPLANRQPLRVMPADFAPGYESRTLRQRLGRFFPLLFIIFIFLLVVLVINQAL
jgi:hypothetical protein